MPNSYIRVSFLYIRVSLKEIGRKFGGYLGNDYFCNRKSPKDPMNGISIERLSQTGECYQDGESSILEGASAVAQGVLEEIEALAGTTACKSVQLVRLTTISHLSSNVSEHTIGISRIARIG